MKNLKHLFFALCLALALVTTALAGNIEMGVVTQSTPAPESSVSPPSPADMFTLIIIAALNGLITL